MSTPIKVIIVGALGKMGRETVKALRNRPDMTIAGLVDIIHPGVSFAELTGIDCDLVLENDLQGLIAMVKPDVMIDFTNPLAVFNNTRLALACGVNCVIGTTGLNELELSQLEQLAQANGVGVAVIPNFAIGAVLMMKFAQEAARYLPDVEIIETHHDQKMDAPSGTAIKTAEMINAQRGIKPPKNIREFEKIPGSRGGKVGEVHIHSVRLPGFIAHQEVIFGGPGQSLTIRHDSYDRVGFMPGVIMVVQKIVGLKGLIYGMDAFL